MSTFSSKWLTTFGPMELSQDGASVRGEYRYLSAACSLQGKVRNGRLHFTYQEPEIQGEGWFELTRGGKAFTGRFRPAGEDHWQLWEGEKVGFDGLWDSSFGPLRLIEEGDRVRGFYTVGAVATLEGRRKGDRLAFRYREAKARGRGAFELAADGLSFEGEWRAQGDDRSRPWCGLRARPQRDLTWLVVIEAPWQRSLSEQEYAFGNMLREFFARLSGVRVRHRFFTNEPGLRQCLRDLLYIAEPIVLVLATHAGPEGVHVDGQTIGVPTLVEALGPVGNLCLLHFSACSLMKDPAVVGLFRSFSDASGAAVSGYTTSVNWAASAIIEFTFLEMVLGQGRPPAEAAEQLLRLLPFAGEGGVAEGAFPAAGFRIVMPGPAGLVGAGELPRGSRKRRQVTRAPEQTRSSRTRHRGPFSRPGRRLRAAPSPDGHETQVRFDLCRRQFPQPSAGDRPRVRLDKFLSGLVMEDGEDAAAAPGLLPPWSKGLFSAMIRQGIPQPSLDLPVRDLGDGQQVAHLDGVASAVRRELAPGGLAPRTADS